MNDVLGRADVPVLECVDDALAEGAELFAVTTPGGEELVQLLVAGPVLGLGMAEGGYIRKRKKKHI